MLRKTQVALFAVCLFVVCGMAGTITAQIPSLSKIPSPELIGQLTKGLSITPEQAAGGSGALFGLAKTKLKPADFAKVAKVVPGMDGLLKAAPKPAAVAPGGTDLLSNVTGALPGNIGAIASVASSFKSLGLSPDMVGKFVPIMSKYVETKGGAGVAGLLSGVLK